MGVRCEGMFLLDMIIFLSTYTKGGIRRPMAIRFRPIRSRCPVAVPFRTKINIRQRVGLDSVTSSMRCIPLRAGSGYLVSFVGSKGIMGANGC